MGMFRAMVLSGMVLGLVVAGCAPQKETVQTSETTKTQTSTPTPAEPPAASGSISGQILTELRQHESELAQIVEQGRLGEVHGKVEVIGTLIASAPDRATDLPEASRIQLRERAASAAKMADALHDAGDAGDLSATKTHFGHYQAELRGIETLLGAQP